MKIDFLKHLIKNPQLHYKLDPGEPGLATPSPASKSIARVATHEATNIRRFKREAAEEGGIVVYSYIYLNLKFAGSFLAATAGKSKALIIYPAKEDDKSKLSFEPDTEKDKEKENTIYNKKNDETGINGLNGEENEKNPLQFNPVENEEVKKIDNDLEELKNEKTRLKNQLSGITENKNNIQYYDNAKPNNNYLEAELERIEKKIRYLEAQKEIEQQREFLNRIVQSTTTTINLISLNLNNQLNNNLGNLIDTMI